MRYCARKAATAPGRAAAGVQDLYRPAALQFTAILTSLGDFFVASAQTPGARFLTTDAFVESQRKEIRSKKVSKSIK